jgi:hypothetical protein
MTTITELNNKIWYRLIKVFFITLALIFCLIIVVINFSAVGRYEIDYKVVCNYGNKSTFLAERDKGIYIPSQTGNYDERLAELPSDTKNEIQRACEISVEEMAIKLDSFFSGHDDGKKFYDINKIKIITDTYASATLWSISGIFFVVIATEIIRRVFYYIVIGSVRPKK